MGAPERGGRTRRQILRNLRTSLYAFAVLLALSVVGLLLLRATLLRNAHETGSALASSYAAEESANLAVYETLLSFGTETLDRFTDGSRETLTAWLEVYFQRVEQILGSGSVTPYAVIDGEILAADPWEGASTYDVAATEWYRKALEADGEVVFTNVYTDAVRQSPVITAARKCRQSDAVVAFDLLPGSLDIRLTGLEEGESFFLCDGEGNVIYRKTELQIPEESLRAYLQQLLQDIRSGSVAESTAAIYDLDGGRRAVYYAQMDHGWCSIVTVPYSHILGGLYGFTAVFLLVIAGFFVPLVVITRRDLRLNAQMVRNDETVRALSNSYYALYRVDFARETYEMIKGSEYVCSRIPGPPARIRSCSGWPER